MQAQAGGDGERACEQLAPRGQRQLVTVTIEESNGLVGSNVTCEQAVGLIRTVAGTKLLAALEDAEISNVEIDGEQAVADVTGGTEIPRQRVLLEKIGSSWKISEVPGLPG